MQAKKAAAPPTAPLSSPTTAAVASAAAAAAGAGAGASPMLTMSDGKIKYSELVVGSGRQPKAGHRVTVAYVGKLTNGKIFDQSANFSFRIGTGEVIRGWDDGVATMREGGQRRLIIHPSFGYGARGAPPDIPPNAILVFDVTLKNAGGGR